MNVLDKLPKKIKVKAGRQLESIVYSRSQQEADEKRDMLVLWCEREGYHGASEVIYPGLGERMAAFYRFP